MPKHNKTLYKQYIAKHQLEQLIEKLLQELHQYNSFYKPSKLQHIYDALIMLSGKWKSIQQEESLGIAEAQATKIEKARISKAVLDIINDLPIDYFDFLNGDKKPSTTTAPDLRQQIEKVHQSSAYEYDVFFSFSSQDLSEAKRICEELRGYGLHVFLTDEALKANTGTSFFEKIGYALKNSQHFILLSSVDSMASEWVKTEYETFYNEYFIKEKAKRRFIILKGKNFSISHVPILLKRLQFANNPKEILSTFIKDKTFQDKQAEKKRQAAARALEQKALAKKRQQEQQALKAKALAEQQQREEMRLLQEQAAERQAKQKALQERALQEKREREQRQQAQQRLEQERQAKAERAKQAAAEKRRKQAERKAAWAAFFDKNGKKIGLSVAVLLVLMIGGQVIPTMFSGENGRDNNAALDGIDTLETPEIRPANPAIEAEATYKKLVQEADDYFEKKNYDNAKMKYNAALYAAKGFGFDIKKAENGLKNCAIETKNIRDQQSDKEKKDNYNKWKKKGDAAYKKGNYDSAKDFYLSAAEYIDNTEIKRKIRDCEEKLKPAPPPKKEEKPKTSSALSPIIVALEKNMKSIPSGTFTMGCTSEQSDCYDNEKPTHQVSISSFKMNKYEVTQEEWQAVMGNNPSHFSGCNKCPVEEVSWNDIQDFLKKLNQLTGKNYRLPSEAEWEYAARGNENYKYAGSNDIGTVAWHYSNSGNKTHVVGGKKANGFGLYDMTGNVWEWCQDTWHKNYNGAPTDGRAWMGSSSSRVARGDSWYIITQSCRVADRGSFSPDYRNHNIGFRLAHK